MKKETFTKNLNFLRLQVRNLYVAVLKETYNAADDVVDEIDDEIRSMIDDVDQLYAELEQENYHREQFEVELMKANNELANLRDQLHSQQETIRKLTLTDPDNPDSPSWSDFAPGPEDMEPELRDCLPFPDVEDLEGASGLLGGDE